jgi:hypothetical protein
MDQSLCLFDMMCPLSLDEMISGESFSWILRTIQETGESTNGRLFEAQDPEKTRSPVSDSTTHLGGHLCLSIPSGRPEAAQES